MTCPHCSINFDPGSVRGYLDLVRQPRNELTGWALEYWYCTSCAELIINLGRRDVPGTTRIYPRNSGRRPAPPEVPEEIAKDYNEACLVLSDSPKASAALSRRCLQSVLRTAAGAKPSDLSKEIDEVLASNSLPTHLHQSIDAVRQIGNFAAHPLKGSGATIEPVEPGEAEWSLETLEALFPLGLPNDDVQEGLEFIISTHSQHRGPNVGVVG